MEKYAVIVAGGKGLRMGNAVPKQFLPIAGHSILYHTLKSFNDAVSDIKIVLVLPEEHLSYAQMILQSFDSRIDLTIVTGGETRYHSVQNGLKVVKEPAIVFVHDGVRPLVSKELILRCYAEAREYGSAIPVMPAVDSMRSIEGANSKPVDRNMLRTVQTPQTFKSDILLPAFQQEYSESFTDEATVVEATGFQIHLIEGEKGNIKVTTPEDILIAEALLKARLMDV